MQGAGQLSVRFVSGNGERVRGMCSRVVLLCSSRAGAVLPVLERRGEERTAGVQRSAEEGSAGKRHDQTSVQSRDARRVRAGSPFQDEWPVVVMWMEWAGGGRVTGPAHVWAPKASKN